MVNVVGAGLIALVALWILADRIRRWTQNADAARRFVLRELARVRPPGEPSEVPIWAAHPLSEAMITELARLQGFSRWPLATTVMAG